MLINFNYKIVPSIYYLHKLKLNLALSLSPPSQLKSQSSNGILVLQTQSQWYWQQRTQNQYSNGILKPQGFHCRASKPLVVVVSATSSSSFATKPTVLVAKKLGKVGLKLGHNIERNGTRDFLFVLFICRVWN